MAEEFFTRLSLKAPRFDTIESVAGEILRKHGICRIEDLAQDTGLSSRTFERRFKKSIGLSPKVYARISRFESALQTKAARPRTTWTDVAHEYGYHDQMHMVHDVQQLSSETPTRLFEHFANVFGGRPGRIAHGRKNRIHANDASAGRHAEAAGIENPQTPFVVPVADDAFQNIHLSRRHCLKHVAGEMLKPAGDNLIPERKLAARDAHDRRNVEHNCSQAQARKTRSSVPASTWSLP